MSAPAKYVRGLQYGGGHSRRDPVETAAGFTTAIDASTGVVKWRYEALKGVPMLSAIAASAGNVIFTGDTAGFFLVMNASTGEVLYRFQTGGVFGGGVGTYELGGQAVFGRRDRQHLFPPVQGRRRPDDHRLRALTPRPSPGARRGTQRSARGEVSISAPCGSRRRAGSRRR